jgi:hypothetical protein
VEPLFSSLVVGLVPQPRQTQPGSFTKEELQRVFVDVTRSYAYAQFAFLPIDGGAQLLNSPDDRVLIQPMLFQVVTEVDLTAERARQKASDVLSTISGRLGVDGFFQTGIKVVARVLAPGQNPDARAFVSDQLMGTGRAEELGPTFFGGGVKYRSFKEAEGCEENLLIEPLVADTENKHLWVDYDVQRHRPVQGLETVAEWIDEAFEFIRGPTMALLEV